MKVERYADVNKEQELSLHCEQLKTYKIHETKNKQGIATIKKINCLEELGIAVKCCLTSRKVRECTELEAELIFLYENKDKKYSTAH